MIFIGVPKVFTILMKCVLRLNYIFMKSLTILVMLRRGKPKRSKSLFKHQAFRKQTIDHWNWNHSLFFFIFNDTVPINNENIRIDGLCFVLNRFPLKKTLKYDFQKKCHFLKITRMAQKWREFDIPFFPMSAALQ